MTTINENPHAADELVRYLAGSGLAAGDMAAAVSIAVNGRGAARLDWSMSEWCCARGSDAARRAFWAACGPRRDVPSIADVEAAIAWLRAD